MIRTFKLTQPIWNEETIYLVRAYSEIELEQMVKLSPSGFSAEYLVERRMVEEIRKSPNYDSGTYHFSYAGLGEEDDRRLQEICDYEIYTFEEVE